MTIRIPGISRPLSTAVALAISCAFASSALPAAPPEAPVGTTHAIRLDGKALRYTAEAGRIALPDSAGGGTRGAIFYVAYRVATRGAPRPLTFVWNGGPGANALRLHLEGLGPRRVEGQTIVDNEAALLDVTDLVFMDPVGTGFSRAASPAEESRFYSTLGDFAATAEFVSLWRARHGATRAPLYLAGESFGTWRAAAAAEALGARGEHVAGVILISGGCPVGPLQPAEVRNALRVPGWHATALHHGRVADDAGRDRAAMVEEAHRWAWSRYAPALARVATLSAAERDSIAHELARRVGIPRERIDDSTLTVTPRRFREILLRDRGDTLNTFDMRFAGATPPLPAAPIGRYLREELRYRTALAYRGLEPDPATIGMPSVNRRWRYDSGKPSEAAAEMARAMAGEGPPGAQPWMIGALENNPGLRVFIASAWFDSFGGCWANQDLLTRLPSGLAGRFTVRCYESGHMIGSDDDARPRLARDLRAFIGGAPARSGE